MRHFSLPLGGRVFLIDERGVMQWVYWNDESVDVMAVAQ